MASGPTITGGFIRELFSFKKKAPKTDISNEKSWEGSRQATAFSEVRGPGALAHLRQREQGGCPRLYASAAVEHMAAVRMPALLREMEIRCVAERKYDKAFAAGWLNTRWAVVGTKCNKLLLVDTDTIKVLEVPLPKNVAPTLQPPSALNPYPHCGIHAIACSPCGTMLATGGDRPHDCQIYNISGLEGRHSVPVLTPKCVLAGHEDWLFGAAWVSDRRLVTGSRDRTLKLWSINDYAEVVTSPLVSRVDKKDKVRDVKFNQESQRLASINPSGKVTLWDQNLNYIRSTRLGDEKEVVCLAMKHDLLAVGSQRQVTLLDPRLKGPGMDIANVESHDVDTGVRSINLTDYTLSYGTGHGRVAFHDLRNPKVPVLHLEGSGSMNQHGKYDAHALRPRSCLEVGQGWLEENDVYRDYFFNDRPGNAIYAHSFNPGGFRMLTVGGPLAYGLKGCYMGVWD
eukprot:jgi/Botrbrau1/7054/Bobra.0165s0077.1